ncbi:hypothetical protein BDV95DRAFT_668914 [Massariosphaeria phaeospora]|uniref:Uncharacterized protein n=1 Tax=Massariosphaeria phaeospora TaxID=100035 RepID=A0A7C8M8S2_9PLEO|nr:hypothetical protein BDV95DRAFT_668914 [Massariosphaeria phaeospora]
MRHASAVHEPATRRTASEGFGSARLSTFVRCRPVSIVGQSKPPNPTRGKINRAALQKKTGFHASCAAARAPLCCVVVCRAGVEAAVEEWRRTGRAAVGARGWKEWRQTGQGERQ